MEAAKIARQLAVLGDNPDISVLGCGVEVLDLEGNKLREIVHPSPGIGRTALLGLAVRASWVSGSGSGALIRRRVFDDVGLFDETLNAAEDWDMCCASPPATHLNLPKCVATIVPARHRFVPQRGPDGDQPAQGLRRRGSPLAAAPRRRHAPAHARAHRGRRGHRARRTPGQHAPAVGRYLRALRAWPLTGQTWKFAARGLLKVSGSSAVAASTGDGGGVFSRGAR